MEGETLSSRGYFAELTSVRNVQTLELVLHVCAVVPVALSH